MKTLLSSLTLFALLVVACYMADKTGQGIYGFIQAACIFGMCSVLVKELKLV